MLSVKNLAISYGQHQAVRDLTIQTDIGEVVVILGANGAGKSSLLRSIAGLCKGHVQGDISFQGQSLLEMSPDEIVTAGIALVPEGRAIFGDLSVEENLRLGAFNERARDKQAANLDQVLTLFPKLRERRRQIARTMSGGEQQMVAIGRALMSDPSILMLDEPSLGLSPLLSRELFQALGKIRETGIGVLVVEQNAKLSLSIADRGYLIENGQMVGQNDAASLASDPAVQAAYLGGGSKSVSARPSRLSQAAPPQPRPAPQAAPAKSAPAKSAPVKSAPVKSAPVKSAPATAATPAAETSPRHDKVFITPAGQAGAPKRADQLLGGDGIGQMLARANQAAAARTEGPVLPQTAPPAAAPRIVTIAPASEIGAGAAPTASPAQPAGQTRSAVGSAGDAEIADLLKAFETAAQSARQSSSSYQSPAYQSPAAQTGQAGQPVGPAPRIDRGPLPEIQVFKKARVEVFTRDSNGVLTKSREA